MRKPILFGKILLNKVADHEGQHHHQFNSSKEVLKQFLINQVDLYSVFSTLYLNF
jgi:hypothetical protein